MMSEEAGIFRESIPQELKQLNQWVAWFWQQIGGKWTKIPKVLSSNTLAASDDPSTWGSYPNSFSEPRIGFVFTDNDPYCGIDLDKCRDPETGEVSRAAQKIIDSFNSYAEVSPSNTGVKIWIKGKVPGPRRKNTAAGIEMYHSGRFFTVTGHHLSGTPKEIRAGQIALDALYKEVFPEQKNAPPSGSAGVGVQAGLDLSDEDILSKAFRARNGDKFMRLWNGDVGGYPSQSEAEIALCSMLAFWTGDDPERIERMISDSELGKREKWQTRPRYRQITITNALEDMTEFYSGSSASGALPPDGASLALTSHPREAKWGSLASISLRELQEKEYPPIKWVVPGLIPAGSMIIAGRPKQGKSWFALSLCISVALGIPALEAFDVEQGGALYLALEDFERRLQDRSNQILDPLGRKGNDSMDLVLDAPRLDEGLLDVLDEGLTRNPDTRLVIIDTLAKVRARGPNTDKQTLYSQDYGAIEGLTALASAHNILAGVIHHTRKGESDDAMEMISGSTGLTGGADGAMILKRTRSEADAFLHIMHRDLKGDKEIALTQDPESGLWRYLGDAEEYKLSGERREIIGVLSNADEPLRPMDVAEAIDKNTQNVARAMQRMRDDGILNTPRYGRYEIAHNPAASLDVSSSNPVVPVVPVVPQRGVEGLGDNNPKPFSSGTTTTTGTTDKTDTTSATESEEF